ncbi:MAG: SAM-dependent methyltransferase, partial [Clostridium sp.]|nr:SAM-dependent methyltransferase [Clostridium sp.]
MKKNEVEISVRMRALTELVTPGLKMCDIGCDHGFVAIYLVQKSISPKVFAMDVRSGPLSRAQEHIGQYGLGSQIETRLSDGLAALKPGEADGMICAGMGGPLMIKILEEGSALAHNMKELILQPQSEISEFRKYLRTHGYHIIKEDMVLEDGKYYPRMKVVPDA